MSSGDRAKAAKSSTKTMENSQDHYHSNGALETMDRFLETEDNLLVQALIKLEKRTNISKYYLARIFLFLFAFYLIFSYSFLDFITRLIMLIYPSFRSYQFLKATADSNDLSKDQLVQHLKFWIFISFFIAIDLLLGSWIPLRFFFKGIILVQCILPENPPSIEFSFENIITPIYSSIENNKQFIKIQNFLKKHLKKNQENFSIQQLVASSLAATASTSQPSQRPKHRKQN